jgi:hypothetical protein
MPRSRPTFRRTRSAERQNREPLRPRSLEGDSEA